MQTLAIPDAEVSSTTPESETYPAGKICFREERHTCFTIRTSELLENYCVRTTQSLKLAFYMAVSPLTEESSLSVHNVKKCREAAKVGWISSDSGFLLIDEWEYRHLWAIALQLNWSTCQKNYRL